MAKGKKKGKGKKKKKTGKKSEKKMLKELATENQAIQDSEFWSAKYDVLSETKNKFRENAQSLAMENELLENQMRQTESDTIDVVTFLKKEDQRKDLNVEVACAQALCMGTWPREDNTNKEKMKKTQIERLNVELRSCRRKFRQEKQDLINDFNQQINELENAVHKKQEDIHLIQNELAHVKEFRRKRAQMQKELDEIRDTMFFSNRDHREEICRMEQKFLEEKESLKKEADQKISELGDRAHQEAIVNLDETTKTVYRENITLAQQLAENIKRGEALKKLQDRIKEENSLLKAERDNSKFMIDDRSGCIKKDSAHLEELKSKVGMLEQLLNHMISEFKHDKKLTIESIDEQQYDTRSELARLQQLVISKSEECARVRKLARKILKERSDIERFFLESLQTVRQEILNNQLQYKKAASKAYNERMMAAFAGNGQFPRVRTFNKTETSTNSVFHDLQAAEMLATDSKSVSIGDLTWEQKEKVLRYLFARMSGSEQIQRPQPPTATPQKTQSPLKTAQLLPIGDTTLSGKVEADPATDRKVVERESSFSRHSVIPDINPANTESNNLLAIQAL